MKATITKEQSPAGHDYITYEFQAYEDDNIFNGHTIEIVVDENYLGDDVYEITSIISIKSIGDAPLSTTIINQLIDHNYFHEQFDLATNYKYTNTRYVFFGCEAEDTDFMRHNELIESVKEYQNLCKDLDVFEIQKAIHMYKKGKAKAGSL